VPVAGPALHGMWFPAPATDQVHMSNDIDHNLAIQQSAEAHMEAVWAAFYADEEAEPGDAEVPSPAVGPFCGCETCVVREVLAGAWPAIEAYFASQ
jgi:hypothetical protein